MADQEAQIIVDDGKLNQLAVGLAQTPNATIVTYMIDPTKIGDVNYCSNEPDPDYLPLASIRTRRFGELYPYEDIAGVRSGSEVEITAYMQEAGKDIPPPGRVISYMAPIQDVIVLKVCVGNLCYYMGLATVLGAWNDTGGYLEAIEHDGQEVLIGSGLFIQDDSMRARGILGGGLYDYLACNDPDDALGASSGVSGNTINGNAIFAYNNTSPPINLAFDVVTTIRSVAINTVRLKYEVSNIGSGAVVNPSFMVWIEPIVDTGYIGSETNGDSGYTSFGEGVDRTGNQTSPTITPYAAGNTGDVATRRILETTVVSSQYLKRHSHYSNSDDYLFGQNYKALETSDWNVSPTFTHNEVGALWSIPSLAVGASIVLEIDINVTKP